MNLKQITSEAFWLKTLVFSLNLLKSLFIHTCLDLLWEDHRQMIKLEMFQAKHASSYCKKEGTFLSHRSLGMQYQTNENQTTKSGAKDIITE